MRWSVVDSPVGPLRLGAEAAHLRHVAFTSSGADALDPATAPEPGSLEDAVLGETAHQLRQYFAGEREAFDLPAAPRGSDFQRRVWAALRHVPFGTTVTYGALADRLDLAPGSARSVGVALSQNPIVVVLACHRVIGADGGLTGFGGGIARKEALLALEGSALL